ncbi:hypothetical protein [Moorena sp. SIO4G3]|uniref:hypothetical protein n=1 Tax=Moorena sp. SIO4G3 TaxID=2607821 RepID=UPI00142A8DFC|nr:hypothetical protein [Moorena sp. SIO4G3]NEO81441.1 hypothetical protein [Moorena sp. SIO4G3]
MNFLRRRINPQTFVITRRQLSRYLKIDPSRVWRWQKWAHVLWVHIQGRGGYFISYRQLEQWIAACCTLIRSCRELRALETVWSAIWREAKRYTEEGMTRLSEIYQQLDTPRPGRTGILASTGGLV